jgi:hypothetical protein
MPYRVAAGVLEHLLPIDAGSDPETLRACTLKVGEELRGAAPAEPAVAASSITLTLDSTFIRSCEDGQRHLEVRLGNVETSDGARQVFAAVAKTDSAIEALIRRGLADLGKTTDTELTAFTDGCSGLRSILVDAGVTEPPCLDWFHIAMRLQHAEKTASTLPAETSERENARAVIVAEVDRLHGRIWNGKANDAKVTLERIRQVMPAFQDEDGGRRKDPSSRWLWTALREIDRYLTSQSAWLVNYAEPRSVAPASTASSVPASSSCSKPSILPQSCLWRLDPQSLDAPLTCPICVDGLTTGVSADGSARI